MNTESAPITFHVRVVNFRQPFHSVFCFPGSILRGKEEDFCKELMELAEQDEFNIMSFEAVVDKIRIYVAEVSCLHVRERFTASGSSISKC